MKFVFLLLFVLGHGIELPPADHTYGLSAADPQVECLSKDLEMPSASETGLVQTLNFGGGAMLIHLDSISAQFIEYAKTCKNPILDIGPAYGVATLPALKGSTCAVIADDLCPEHLVLLAKQADPEDRKRLFLMNKAFPDEMDLPENSLDAVLICRVIHFFRGDQIERGWEKIHRWLAPGGKLFIVTATPYQGPIADFIPTYEKQWDEGNPWPGYIEDYAQRTGYANINSFLNVMDDRPLRRSLEKAGFMVEKTEFIDRSKRFPKWTLDGREGVGMIAKKP